VFASGALPASTSVVEPALGVWGVIGVEGATGALPASFCPVDVASDDGALLRGVGVIRGLSASTCPAGVMTLKRSPVVALLSSARAVHTCSTDGEIAIAVVFASCVRQTTVIALSTI
jgi:hypothetical protein